MMTVPTITQPVRAAGGGQSPTLATLEAIFDLAPDAVLVHAEWRVVYANPAFIALIKAHRRYQVSGHPLQSISSPKWTQVREERVRRLYAGEFLSAFEDVLDCYDGTSVEVEMSASPLIFADAPAALIIVRDITERVARARRMQEDQTRYRELFDQNPHVMAVFDEETLRFLAVNDMAVACYGYSHEEFGEMGLADIFVAEDLPRLRALQRTMPQTVRTLKGFRHRLKGGEVIDVEISSHALVYHGRPARMAVVFDVTERTKVERALRDSEARYRALFTQAAVGLARVTLAGRIIEANVALAEMLGQERELLLGMDLRDLVPHEDLAALSGEVRQLLSGELHHLSVERRYRRKDGILIWVALTIAVVREDGNLPGHLVLVVQDIDARMRAEAELVQVHARLSMAVQAGNVGLWDWDLATNQVRYSTEWKRQLGYADEEIGDDFDEWRRRTHSADLDATMARVEAYLQSGGEGMLTTEFRMRHRDGSFRWILAQSHALRDATGQPIRMLGCHIDITERKAFESELHAREADYRRLVELAPDAVLILVEDRIAFANSAAATLLGLADVAVLGGRRIDECFEPIPPDADLAPSATYRVRGIAEERQIEAREAPVRWQGAPARKFIARDITERVRNTQLFQQYARQLKGLSRELLETEERERQDLHRELHDRIGQNLSALGVSLTLVRADLPAHARCLARLEAAQALLQETTSRVRGILEELHPPGLREYGLTGALRIHVDAMIQRTGLRVELHAVDPDPRPAYVCETAAFRIVQEALSNAVKYAQASQLRVTVESAADTVRISVEDDGGGFDPAATPKGSHWGLAIMRERAEAIGARLSINSAPRQGTRVVLELPRGAQ